MTVCRGIRGATVAEANTGEAIHGATTELLEALIKGNALVEWDVASVFFSMTPDLNAVFPAAAARRLGWNSTALFGQVETDVPGSLNRCIRVLILVNTDKEPGELANVYLRGTEILRS
jgi:chorismate mutase